MKAGLRRKVIGLVILVFTLILAAEIGGLRYYQLASRRAEVRLHRAERELDRVRQQRPAPTEASVHALAQDVEEAQRTLAGMENIFRAATGSPVGAVPNQSADLFFAAGAMVEAIGARAAELNIEMAREAVALGFSAYAREGPEPARAAAVGRQLEIARRFLDALLAARPRAIRLVQRELPPTDSERQARHWPAKRNDPAGSPASRTPVRAGTDYFAIDPRWSVFSAGVVDATAFRLVFVGNTEVLRRFVGAVSADNLGLIRTIEVEPVSTATTDPAKPEPRGPSPSIVLRENAPASRPPVPVSSRASKFTVIVEHIEIVPRERGAVGKAGT